MREDLAGLIRKNLAHYGHKALASARGLRFGLLPVALKQPLFVVGCSRAGTTLVYKTLSESRHLGSLQKETHDFWAALHPPAERGWDSHHIPEEAASEADRQAVARLFYTKTGRRRVVDKNNQNGLSIPYLFRLFPDAHFVYIKRAPGDNINSLIQGWRRANEFGTWANALPDPVAIDDGRFRRWCFFLAEGWRAYLNASIETVCAFQYEAMNQAILDAKEKVPGDQWHELKYEAILADPIGEFRRIFEGCGVPFDRRMESHCSTVIQTPYNAFSEIRVHKWKNSPDRARIERVLPTLEPIARRMGYAL